MNLEKFTERSRGFLQAAQTIAMRESHQRVLPDHLLKALMDDDQGLAWIQICDDGRRDAAPEHVPPADSLHLGHEIVGRVMQAHGGRFEQADAPPGFTTCYRMEMPTAG